MRYLRSMYVPDERNVMCLFGAGSPELVAQVNEAAKIPFSRIIAAMDLPAQK